MDKRYDDGHDEPAAAKTYFSIYLSSCPFSSFVTVWRHPCLLTDGHNSNTRNMSFSLIKIYFTWFPISFFWKKKSSNDVGVSPQKKELNDSNYNLLGMYLQIETNFSTEFCAHFYLFIYFYFWKWGNKVQWTAAGHIITPPVLMIYWGHQRLSSNALIWWHAHIWIGWGRFLLSFGCRMMSNFFPTK
jgi:hypothetical protein